MIIHSSSREISFVESSSIPESDSLLGTDQSPLTWGGGVPLFDPLPQGDTSAAWGANGTPRSVCILTSAKSSFGGF